MSIGTSLDVTSDKYQVRTNQWSEPEVLGSLMRERIQLSDEQRSSNEEIFWHSTCTEYDALNFYGALKRRNLLLTGEFKQFLQNWLADEIKHTAGFARIYGLIYDCSQADIYDRLRSRVADFSSLEEFFDDEFKLCLLLAYDEIVTTFVYHRSVSFYRSLGPAELVRWIRLLTSDESLHFNNLIRLMRRVHRHRCAEAPRIMERILEVDYATDGYNATFVLDHACADFPLSKEELVSLCSNTIVRKLSQV